MVKEKKPKKQETKVAKHKVETVKTLVQDIKDNNTIMLASIKNLPSKQFQLIRKKLKGKALVKVIKKRLVLRALEESGDDKIKELEKHVCEDSAILFSKEEVFDLAAWLAENKSPIKAKSGQEAIEDIEVEKGPTDLIPGPAISELGGLGIKIAVENGKIAIKEKKVIVKAGEKISQDAASIMAKLNIVPFEIGLEPIAIYEKESGKVYTEIKIDKEKTIEELKKSAVKAIGLAQRIIYYCKETIGYLLAKANLEEKALTKLEPAPAPTEEKKEEGRVKEKVESNDEKKEEPKAEDVQKTEKNKSEEEK